MAKGDRFFHHPTRCRYDHPQDHGLTCESVFFHSRDGNRLHGWFFPAGGRAAGTLVHCHGNAGNITAYWMGFTQYHKLNNTKLPHILGVQASGSAPLVEGHPINKPETLATAIRIGRPARGEQALEATESSNGRIIAVSDKAILQMQKRLAGEGIWVEPASAAGLAGLAAEIQNGKLNPAGKRIVAVCTGHGLKDPDIIKQQIQLPPTIPPRLDALEEAILQE